MLRANTAWTVAGFAAIVGQYLLGCYWPAANTFNSNVLGRALTALFASVMIVPNLKPALEHRRRISTATKCLRDLIEAVKQDGNLNTPFLGRVFKNLFGGKHLDRALIGSLSAPEAAVLLLGLQYHWRSVTIDRELELLDLGSLAERSTGSEQYRRLLILCSVRMVLRERPKEAIEHFVQDAKSTHVHPSSKEADLRFFDRLRSATTERVYIFSTTSQISNLSFQLLSEHAARIKEVHLFLVSPLILTERAIANLAEEYEVPSFARPRAQFLDDDRLDLIRRVIRVLLAMDLILEFKNQTGINVTLHLFRQRYPGVKLRILDDRCYVQMMPGCLKYANNTYRFGLEYTDRVLVDRLLTAVHSMIGDSELITTVPVDAVHFGQIRAKALRESLQYLIKCGATTKDIDRPQFRLVLKNPRAEWYLSQLQAIEEQTAAYIDGFQFSNAELPLRDAATQSSAEAMAGTPYVAKATSAGNIKHVSVGLLLFRPDSVLLIRKRQQPYAGQLSIVAGHLQEGESPRAAIQREMREELGVDLQKFDLVKCYDELPGDVCRYGVHNHEWWIYISDEAIKEEALTISKEEISETVWVNVEQLPALVQQLTFASATILRDLRLV